MKHTYNTYNTRWLVYLLAIALVISGGTPLQATKPPQHNTPRTASYLKVKNSALRAKRAVRATCDAIKNKIGNIKNRLAHQSLISGKAVKPLMVGAAARALYGAHHFSKIKTDDSIKKDGDHYFSGVKTDDAVKKTPVKHNEVKLTDLNVNNAKWVKHLEQKLNADKWEQDLTQKINDETLDAHSISDLQNLLHQAVDYLLIHARESLDSKILTNGNMYQTVTSGTLDIDKCKHTIDALLSCKKIDINLKGCKEIDETILVKAVRLARTQLGGSTWLLDTLLNRDDLRINVQDEQGYTALMFACTFGNTEVVEKLLTTMRDKQLNLPDQLSLANVRGETALMSACRGENSLAVLDILFTACPDIKLDSQDWLGETALMIACRRGDIKAVQKLIKHWNLAQKAHYTAVNMHLIPPLANIVQEYCIDTEMLNKTYGNRDILHYVVNVIFEDALSKTDEKRKHTYATIIQTLIDAGAESDWFKADEVLYPQYLQIMHLNKKDDDDDHTEVADIAVAATGDAGAVIECGLDD